MTEPKPTYALPIADHTCPGVLRDRLGPYLSELTCKACHAVLATVVQWDRRTAVILRTNDGHPVLAFRARFRCDCGEERLFTSVPMSAIRLGIIDE